MPAVSAKQQRFMGAELNRAKHGAATQTKMSTAQLEAFAHKPPGGFAGVKRKAPMGGGY